VTVSVPSPTQTVVTVLPPVPTTVYPLSYPPWPGTSLSTAFSGDFRGDVVKVQRRLDLLGYGPVTVDGDYGPVTASVVRRYQSYNGLIIDGVVGPQTWSSLFSGCYACD
jgi:peptidoglycan hydrolase-like protein with peptidoglycan-binding domain